jgi:hypothetical protein
MDATRRARGGWAMSVIQGLRWMNDPLVYAASASLQS